MIGSVFGENWITTNLVDFSSSNSAKIWLNNPNENIVFAIHAKAMIGGRIVADYLAYPVIDSLTNGITTNSDAQIEGSAFSNGLLKFDGLNDVRDRPENTIGMSAKEIYFASKTNQIRLTAGYYRGRIYEYDNSSLFNKTFDMSGTNWASIFSSGDRTRLVVARDDGLIYFSDNSGITWRTISAPGKYEFTLSSTPKGSAMMAVITVGIPYIEKTSGLVHKNVKGWYSVGVSANGDKLVVSSQSTPVLSITNSDNNVVISWSASFTNFVLQQNINLTTTNWVDVTNIVNFIDGQNEVTFYSVTGNNFFRLRPR